LNIALPGTGIFPAIRANLQYAIIGTAQGAEVPTIPFWGLPALSGLILGVLLGGGTAPNI